MQTLDDAIDDFLGLPDKRAAISDAGLVALGRLTAVAQRDSGQSRVVGRFLLGLYNGRTYPFNLVELRGLDCQLFDDCLAVLRLDNEPAMEVHEYLANGETIWSDLRQRWGLN
ncbi:MAG: hypothetical protein ABWY06_19915 [Pseudomonas sp.]|uniref:DUF7673 family protein n=1 Tax=Pseudomonas sp. TaxID=306 RepID=UPI003399BFE3